MFKIEKGSYIIFKLERKNNILNKKIIYWYNNKEISINKNTLEKNSEDLEKILTNSIKQQLIADVPIGVLLSGGIDSTLITSIASKISNKKINSYTVGFENKNFDESEKATKIAKYLKTNHQNYILN